ncbi:MAG TPA: DUF2459 domain-containing protein [Candidatus Binatia bacterium]|nr:DUF2459 domain-containing protein [Candidatus Binatia bacterium]
MVILLLTGCMPACSERVAQRTFTTAEPITAHIFVIYDDWHSAILLRAANLSPESFPEIRDFPGADYLEFSWGDREYFPHPDPGMGLALKAAVWSSGSIIHVVGVRGTPMASYPNAEIITIAVTDGEFQRLVQFISKTFVRSSPESASEARPGLSDNARFYLAHGRFSILRTCNTWVAEALRAAHLPVNASWVITAASLGRRVRPLDIVRSKRKGP